MRRMSHHCCSRRSSSLHLMLPPHFSSRHLDPLEILLPVFTLFSSPAAHANLFASLALFYLEADFLRPPFSSVSSSLAFSLL